MLWLAKTNLPVQFSCSSSAPRSLANSSKIEHDLHRHVASVMATGMLCIEVQPCLDCLPGHQPYPSRVRAQMHISQLARCHPFRTVYPRCACTSHCWEPAVSPGEPIHGQPRAGGAVRIKVSRLALFRDCCASNLFLSVQLCQKGTIPMQQNAVLRVMRQQLCIELLCFTQLASPVQLARLRAMLHSCHSRILTVGLLGIAVRMHLQIHAQSAA
jgi:hypothetical protein